MHFLCNLHSKMGENGQNSQDIRLIPKIFGLIPKVFTNPQHTSHSQVPKPKLIRNPQDLGKFPSAVTIVRSIYMSGVNTSERKM